MKLPAAPSVWPHTFKQITPQNWQFPDREKYDTSITADRWIQMMLESKLDNNIPVEILSMYEVARGAIIQAWFFYPLLTLGSEQLTRVQETAARVRCEQLKLISPKIVSKGPRKGQAQQPIFSELIGALTKHGHLSSANQSRWEAVRGLRNIASHPKRQSFYCHAEASNSLRVTAELINMLF